MKIQEKKENKKGPLRFGDHPSAFLACHPSSLTSITIPISLNTLILFVFLCRTV
jgi:hypothetical protein